MSMKGAVKGRLTALLAALDDAMAAIAANMGDAWRETVVVAITEFGRTAHINGNGGTDHGTATVALLAGGALKGGHVIADWPGLGELRSLPEPRPEADDGFALDHEGAAQGPPAHRRDRSCHDGVPRQRRGAIDAGSRHLTLSRGQRLSWT